MRLVAEGDQGVQGGWCKGRGGEMVRSRKTLLQGRHGCLGEDGYRIRIRSEAKVRFDVELKQSFALFVGWGTHALLDLGRGVGLVLSCLVVSFLRALEVNNILSLGRFLLPSSHC